MAGVGKFGHRAHRIHAWRRLPIVVYRARSVGRGLPSIPRCRRRTGYNFPPLTPTPDTAAARRCQCCRGTGDFGDRRRRLCDPPHPARRFHIAGKAYLLTVFPACQTGRARGLLPGARPAGRPGTVIAIPIRRRVDGEFRLFLPFLLIMVGSLRVTPATGHAIPDLHDRCSPGGNF